MTLFYLLLHARVEGWDRSRPIGSMLPKYPHIHDQSRQSSAYFQATTSSHGWITRYRNRPLDCSQGCNNDNNLMWRIFHDHRTTASCLATTTTHWCNTYQTRDDAYWINHQRAVRSKCARFNLSPCMQPHLKDLLACPGRSAMWNEINFTVEKRHSWIFLPLVSHKRGELQWFNSSDGCNTNNGLTFSIWCNPCRLSIRIKVIGCSLDLVLVVKAKCFVCW